MADNEADDQYFRTDETGNVRKPVRRQKMGCCCNGIRKMFIYLYPKYNKWTYTKEGEYLRRWILISLILHIVFFAVSLAFIGFEPMMANLWLAIMQYSNYVTLRECTIVLYLLMIIVAVSGGLTWADNQETGNSAGL